MEQPKLNNNKEEHLRRMTELKQSVDNWLEFSRSVAKKELTPQNIKLNEILKRTIEQKAVELFYSDEIWKWHKELMGDDNHEARN